MEEKRYKETVARLRDVNSVISKLDPAIRADAFSVLLPYVKGSDVRAEDEQTKSTQDGDGASSGNELLAKHGGTTPVDNALVAAAAWYSEYGSSPFTQQDIRALIDEGGLTRPVRLDRTFDTTTKGQGKSLFRKVGRGRWAPSVAGEAYFKETFDAKKGRKKPESDSS
jgi:hypothetical protein